MISAYVDLSHVKDKKRIVSKWKKEMKLIEVFGDVTWSRLKAASKLYQFETMATDSLPRMYDLTDRVEDEF